MPAPALDRGGLAAAVVVEIVDGVIRGASVGDACAWLVESFQITDLTVNQRRKPLLGSGDADPIAFGPMPFRGRLLVASDGLVTYARRFELQCRAVVGSLEQSAAALLEAARLGTGRFQDDVALVLAEDVGGGGKPVRATFDREPSAYDQRRGDKFWRGSVNETESTDDALALFERPCCSRRHNEIGITRCSLGCFRLGLCDVPGQPILRVHRQRHDAERPAGRKGSDWRVHGDGARRLPTHVSGAGPITVPDNGTFANYVRKALLDELRMANKYNPTAPVVINGNLDFVDFSSTEGRWTVGVTIQSSNKFWVRESVQHRYETSFFAESACSATGQAFMPAVQDLLEKVIRSSQFTKMFPPAPPPLAPAPPPAAAPSPPTAAAPASPTS